jgi:hypothetical protein
MKIHIKHVRTAALAAALIAHAYVPPAVKADVPHRCVELEKKRASGTKLSPEEVIEERDCQRNGITVEKPKVYDDALLQQMLQAAEARLAAIQPFEQASITSRLGAVTGASQEISSVGVNVQGPSLPELTTTSKGATGSTEQSASTGATSSTTFKTNSGLATEDVVSKRSQVNPPPFNAPASTTSLPTTFTVSSSDILNEQAQLTAEIAALRLLVGGSLSDHFSEGTGTSEANVTKRKMTLGFPVTVATDRRYKDAVAVVEVEVEPFTENEDGLRQQLRKAVMEEEEAKTAGEKKLTPAEVDAKVKELLQARLNSIKPPAVTALLPREKTYNVAEIRDKSVSIGGGVATQIVGVSGSFLTGRKTYYLVQDQDTVALNFTPDGERKVGFIWQFRPVLGREYVKSGLKQTFVQLAFDELTCDDPACKDSIGKVTVKTYWRRYDRKKGVTREVIPGSLKVQYAGSSVETYTLAKRPPSFNSRDDLEDIGGGQLMVKLKGRFLPGTYVRIGSTMLPPGPQLTHEHEGIRFIASAADMFTKKVALVAHDGTEVPFEFRGATCDKRLAIVAPDATKPDDKIKIEPVDDSTSRLTLQVNEPNQQERRPQRVIVVGQRVFGYSDAPIRRDNDTLSAVVPNSLLTASPRPDVSVQYLFAPKDCNSASVPLPKPANPERLAVLERGDTTVTFLLSGDRAADTYVVLPSDAKKGTVGLAGEKQLTTLTLTLDSLKTNKQVVLQRKGEAPFLVNIPEVEVKKPDPPKARERVTVDSDEAVIEGDGMKDLVKVTFRGVEITSKEVAGDGKSVRLSGLRRLGVTASAATQPLVLEFKSGPKATVNLEVVNTKVETVTR